MREDLDTTMLKLPIRFIHKINRYYLKLFAFIANIQWYLSFAVLSIVSIEASDVVVWYHFLSLILLRYRSYDFDGEEDVDVRVQGDLYLAILYHHITCHMFYAGDGDEDDLVLLIAGDKKGLESEWFSGAFLRPALYSLEGSMVGFQGERDATSGNLFPTPNFNKFGKIPKTLDFKCILCITLEIEDCVNCWPLDVVSMHQLCCSFHLLID